MLERQSRHLAVQHLPSEPCGQYMHCGGRQLRQPISNLLVATESAELLWRQTESLHTQRPSTILLVVLPHRHRALALKVADPRQHIVSPDSWLLPYTPQARPSELAAVASGGGTAAVSTGTASAAGAADCVATTGAGSCARAAAPTRVHLHDILCHTSKQAPAGLRSMATRWSRMRGRVERLCHNPPLPVRSVAPNHSTQHPIQQLVLQSGRHDCSYGCEHVVIVHAVQEGLHGHLHDYT